MTRFEKLIRRQREINEKVQEMEHKAALDSYQNLKAFEVPGTMSLNEAISYWSKNGWILQLKRVK